MRDKILKYMFFCHRIPERSFFYKGKQFPICARCTGILVGYFLGILYIILCPQVHLVLELMLFIPIAIDGIGQYYNYWISTNRRRAVTGALAGVGTISLLRLAAVLGEISARFVHQWIHTL